MIDIMAFKIAALKKSTAPRCFCYNIAKSTPKNNYWLFFGTSYDSFGFKLSGGLDTDIMLIVCEFQLTQIRNVGFIAPKP